jgi:hypothetical protein
MRAFEVLVNGERQCVAGIGDSGVLTTIVTFSIQRGNGAFFINVGGMISETKEHVNWVSQKPLLVGDDVQVRIVETDAVDSPLDKYRLDPAS